MTKILNNWKRTPEKKERSDKLETDYKWIGEQDLAFAKMTVIVFVVIVGLIVWTVIA